MKKPRVACVVAISDFPYWERCLQNHCKYADDIYVRFDGVNGNPEIMKKLVEVIGDKLREVYVSRDGWHPPQWREDCLRMLDNAKPDIVLVPDQDEMFPAGFEKELRDFWASPQMGMMFEYEPLETIDGKVVNEGMPYPPTPHMKAFKWLPALSYYPYHGYGNIAKFHNEDCHWKAEHKLIHLACYTKGMEENKVWRGGTPEKKDQRCVTLLGFGASAKQENVELRGEIWSLNNCYDAYPKQVTNRITRIYEMHKYEKRDKILANDGRPHIVHLNEMGKNGARIVMQKKHDNIFGSEAFPLEEMERKYDLKLWGGTGSYMIAGAIDAGFTEINIFGFDQIDYEHIPQRESQVGWLMFAYGRGIKIGGALTFLNRHDRRYGYDYAPEWTEDDNRRMWTGYPFEIKMKEMPRGMKGELFAGDR